MPVTDLIPHRPPFLYVDEIVSESAGALVARRTWRPEEPFYQGHYPGMPITPGVLLCEAVFQTGALLLSRERGADSAGEGMPLLTRIRDVRFRNPVYPGETTLMEVRKKDSLGGFTVMSGSVTSGEKRVLTLEFSVAWRMPAGAPA